MEDTVVTKDPISVDTGEGADIGEEA